MISIWWPGVGAGQYSSSFGLSSVPLTVVPLLTRPGIEEFPTALVGAAKGAEEAAAETGVPRTAKGRERKDSRRYFMALL